jgi:hypothetical protein
MRRFARLSAACQKSCHVSGPLHAALLASLVWAVGSGCTEQVGTGDKTPTGHGTGGDASVIAGTGGSASTSSGSGHSASTSSGSGSGSGGGSSTSSGAGGSSSTGGGGNVCLDASNDVVEKYASCGIDFASEDPMECTDALAAQSTCLADCIVAASCDTLKGDDPAGASNMAKCMGGC